MAAYALQQTFYFLSKKIFLIFFVSFLIYKSQTAVAIFKSFSSACLTFTNTLLLYFPLDSNRTDVTPQKIACSGPLISDFPHMPDDFVI